MKEMWTKQTNKKKKNQWVFPFASPFFFHLFLSACLTIFSLLHLSGLPPSPSPLSSMYTGDRSSGPALTWHGGTCSISPSWPPRGTSSTTRSTSGGGTAWAWSSTTCSATACWTPGAWWKWPGNGKLCLSVSTASPGPFRRTSELHLRPHHAGTLCARQPQTVHTQPTRLVSG